VAADLPVSRQSRCDIAPLLTIGVLKVAHRDVGAVAQLEAGGNTLCSGLIETRAREHLKLTRTATCKRPLLAALTPVDGNLSPHSFRLLMNDNVLYHS